MRKPSIFGPRAFSIITIYHTQNGLFLSGGAILILVNKNFASLENPLYPLAIQEDE
jgi:hypothetical protein